MSFFEWKERMSVGDDMVDSDHQKLIGYLNEMHEAMIAGRGKQVVGEILDKLVAYTKEHFAREEALWKGGHYAGIEQHRKEHKDCIATVTELKAKYATGGVALAIDVMNFLRDWLKTHTLKSDKEAADAIAAAKLASSCKVYTSRKRAHAARRLPRAPTS